jgi:hypothetical protein
VSILIAAIHVTVINISVIDRADKGWIAVIEQCSLKIADADAFDQRSFKKVKADKAIARK